MSFNINLILFIKRVGQFKEQIKTLFSKILCLFMNLITHLISMFLKFLLMNSLIFDRENRKKASDYPCFEDFLVFFDLFKFIT